MQNPTEELEIAVLHKLDGHENYDNEKFISYKSELIEIVSRNKQLLQKGTVFLVEHEDEESDPDFYEIVEIIISRQKIMIYFIYYQDSFSNERYKSGKIE